MSLPQDEIIDLLEQLADHENIRICVKESSLIGAITGVSALVGGLLGGKNGALAGVALGTVAAQMLTDDFVSVTHVIMNEMRTEQRRRLLQTASNILMQLSGSITLRAILNSNTVRGDLTSLIQTSVQNLGYTV